MSKLKSVSKILVIFASLILIIYLCLLWWSGFFKEKPTGPIMGDLGGVEVDIPRAFARFIEYDGDPHFMEREGFEAGKRSYQSKLNSFGFEVRYPDMASIDVLTFEEKRKRDIHTTMWLRVGVNAGSRYGPKGDTVPGTYLGLYIVPGRKCASGSHPNKSFCYAPLPDKTYGLTGYTPTGTGVDVEGRSINSGRGTDLRDRNIYYFENKNGHISTFIRCNNRTHSATRCKQYFNLSPVMKAHVTVNYRKALLPHWQEIQKSLSELIYSFDKQ